MAKTSFRNTSKTYPMQIIIAIVLLWGSVYSNCSASVILSDCPGPACPAHSDGSAAIAPNVDRPDLDPASPDSLYRNSEISNDNKKTSNEADNHLKDHVIKENSNEIQKKVPYTQPIKPGMGN